MLFQSRSTVGYQDVSELQQHCPQFHSFQAVYVVIALWDGLNINSLIKPINYEDWSFSILNLTKFSKTLYS